ncbi:hypothetical protein [Dethiothermospora halolimnae]|uniref:hypothetical protein n=1 Tax=Dethiothermospora halolimnae TaxID=3114390 RepID=UPI003CCBFCF5
MKLSITSNNIDLSKEKSCLKKHSITDENQISVIIIFAKNHSSNFTFTVYEAYGSDISIYILNKNIPLIRRFLLQAIDSSKNISNEFIEIGSVSGKCIDLQDELNISIVSSFETVIISIGSNEKFHINKGVTISLTIEQTKKIIDFLSK